MTGELAIIHILKAASSVTNLVGQRITPELRPQAGPFPAVTVNLINTDYSDTKSGVSSLDENYVDVSIYGRTYKDIINVSNAIDAVLNRYSGTLAFDGTEVQSIQKQDEDNYTDMIADSVVYVKEFEYKVRVKR